MNKLFVSGFLPDRAYKPADRKRFLVSMWLFLGKFRWFRKTDFTSVIRAKKKITLTSHNFPSGQISLLNRVIWLRTEVWSRCNQYRIVKRQQTAYFFVVHSGVSTSRWSVVHTLRIMTDDADASTPQLPGYYLPTTQWTSQAYHYRICLYTYLNVSKGIIIGWSTKQSKSYSHKNVEFIVVFAIVYTEPLSFRTSSSFSVLKIRKIQKSRQCFGKEESACSEIKAET